MPRITDALNQFSKRGRIPAPVGGWNSRDPLPAMKPEDAVILDNMIPGTGGVDLRGGSATWATGLGASVQSLMEYSSPANAPRLFAAAGTSIFEATASGAVGAAVLTGLTNALWQNVMFATPGGSFLVACNGADPVQNFNGTSWTQPTITGVTASNLINVTAFAQRLWFVEKNTLHVWYMPTSSIAGAANSIDFGPIAKRGGYLVAMGDWTRDGGDGADDLAAFVTSRGEVFVYQGTDPSSTTTWSLIGVFRIPEPVGRRCLIDIGADLGIITSQGVVPLSQVMTMDLASDGSVAVTDKIKGAFRASYIGSPNDTGWQIADYPAGALLLVNVPAGDGTNYYQFVMNAITGSWCRFTGLNALCWSLLGTQLFFGTAKGTVVRYDVAHTDDLGAITATVLPAFSAFGGTTTKQFLMAKPLYTAAVGTLPPLATKLDYDVSVPALAQETSPPSETPWGSPWGSPWGPRTAPVSDWQGLEGDGLVGSVLLSVASKTALTLQHIDVLYAEGGPF